MRFQDHLEAFEYVQLDNCPSAPHLLPVLKEDKYVRTKRKLLEVENPRAGEELRYGFRGVPAKTARYCRAARGY